MQRMLIPSLVAGVVLALALGSYSVLAGAGPVDDVVGVVAGSNHHDDGDTVGQNTDANAGAGAEKVAQVIADEFGVTQAEVLALHDKGMGFGALFKLYAIAKAKGISVNDLLAQIEANGGGFAFGKVIKALTDEQRAALEAGPKNLGKLVSASNKNAGDSGDTGEAAASAERSEGPPELAKEHKQR